MSSIVYCNYTKGNATYTRQQIHIFHREMIPKRTQACETTEKYPGEKYSTTLNFREKCNSVWWPASQNEEKCALPSYCDSIWYGVWAVYRGSCALTIRSLNSLFMFNPQGSRQAKERGEGRGGGGLYEHPGTPTHTWQIQVGAVISISKGPAWLQPLHFPMLSYLFVCQTAYTQQLAIPAHLLYTHAHTQEEDH